MTARSMSEFKEHLDDDLGHGLVLSTSVRSKELDLKIIMGPLQLEMIYDSAMTLLEEWTADAMAHRVRSFTGRSSLRTSLPIVINSRISGAKHY